MRTNSTLKKAVTFIFNCKIIFSVRKNIFHKNIFLILFCFGTTISIAQIKNADSYLSELESSGHETDAAYARHLLYDLQDAVYFLSDDAAVKTYGSNPKAFYTDINSVQNLALTSIPNNDIEIATITIESTSDLNKTIDLNSFSSFEKLKYIYISSNVETSESIINNMIKNDHSQYVIIYKISIGG